MKKSLLALAVLGAFAGAASAQSSVTVYGIVDASIASVDNGSGENTVGIDSGRNNASRIGFKGVEDLGNGLKAEFVLENGFDASTGGSASAGAAFSRLAYLGLGGNFGTVRLGRQNSPIKTALDVIDPFKGAGMAGAIGYIGYDSTPERVSNSLTYISNNYGGFSGSASYVFGETEGVTSANDGYALQLGYANGPLNVQFAYAEMNESNETATGIPPTTLDVDTKNLLIGATYDFGGFKLHGGYEDTKFENNIAPGGEISLDSYILGVTVPFGASAIRGSYIQNNADIDDADSKVYALSYTYALSKRTTFYTTYVHTDNDTFSALGITGDGTAGQNGDGFAVGIQHNF